MSLTSHLKSTHSPIRKFLRLTFPNRSFLKDANKRMRSASVVLPCNSNSLGTIGLALDYRIRYYFARTPTQALFAFHGLRGLLHLNRAEDKTKEIYKTFLENLDDFMDSNNPVNRRLSETEEDELNRYCFVLALLEEVYRLGRIHPNSLLAGECSSIQGLLNLADDQSIVDLRTLSYKFYDNFQQMLTLPHILNPTFDGSAYVRGADADLIVDSTLIEIKTTKRKDLKRDWLYQLLGYVLLDYTNRYDIRRIAFYMTRQGILIEWDLEDAIRSLCSGSQPKLSELRSQFQKVALAWTHTNRGRAYIRKGEYDRGVEELSQAIQLNPDYAAAYKIRGVTYGYKGEYDRAIEDLNKAIRLNPDDAAAYNKLKKDLSSY